MDEESYWVNIQPDIRKLLQKEIKAKKKAEAEKANAIKQLKLDRALAKQEAEDDVTRYWQNLHPRMKQFLTADKIEGVNRIIDDYQASIKVPEVVIEEPTPPVTEVEETVVEVVVEEKKVEPPKP